MAWVEIVTLLALIELVVFGVLVSRARGTYGVAAPATTGNPIFNSSWTFTGQPAITFPMGLSDEGLPLGIQLIGRRFDDVGLFRAAAWCEAILPRLPPPNVPEKPAG